MSEGKYSPTPGDHEAAMSHVLNAADKVSRMIVDAQGEVAQERARADEAEAENELDPKTRLLNFPAFKKKATEMIANGEIDPNREQKFSLLLGDLDDFKKLNSLLQYEPTDQQCLIPTANIFKTSVHREGDKVSSLTSRFGGEEFVALLEGTDEKGAQVVAERIREQVNALHPTTEAGEVLPLGISMGVVTFEPGASFDEVFAHANQAVNYAKKIEGKNQIVSYEDLVERGIDMPPLEAEA